MRVHANLEMSTDWLTKGYRSIFMSLIKHVFDSYDPTINIILYGTKEKKRSTNKPFTFSVHFPEFQRIESGRVVCGKKVSLFFSTNDKILITAFYNGLKKNQDIAIGENANAPIIFKVKNTYLLPMKRIDSNKVEFKSLSPILVSQLEDNKIFISPTHPDFDSTFKVIIANIANELKVPCTPYDIHIEIQSMKKLPLTHYNQTMHRG